MMKPGVRLLLVALVMGVAYQVVQWPEIRPLYSAEDKWAHGLAFFTVWWALRWAPESTLVRRSRKAVGSVSASASSVWLINPASGVRNWCAASFKKRFS